MLRIEYFGCQKELRILWECDECGHMNDDESDVCEVCGETKHAVSYRKITDDLFHDEDLDLFE